MNSPAFRLQAEQLSKSFGARTVLQGFDLRIETGEFVAITGASGCGKSTALNILGLIAAPSSGQLLINGTALADASDLKRSHYRGHYLSFIYQGFHLAASLTVAENVELGIKSQLRPTANRSKRVRQALEAVGIAELADQLPRTLSGGEQQRVAVARALARQSPLLLADEPTGNLDCGNAEAIMELMVSQLALGAALLLVTHDPKLAAKADRIIRLNPPAKAA